MSQASQSPTVAPETTAQVSLNARLLVRLLELGQRSRRTQTPAELRFVLVNETHVLTPYRMAVLTHAGAVCAISGVVSPEANAPFTLWLRRVTDHLVARQKDLAAVSRENLPAELAREWSDWLPEHALWCPLPDGKSGVLFARDVAWTETDRVLLREWIAVWSQAWELKLARDHRPWQFWKSRPQAAAAKPSRRKAWLVATGALVVIGCIPVKLTVLAPAELIPADAAIVRAPLEGVIATVHVKPNQDVKKGDLLVSYDDVSLRSRLDIAQQGLLSAEVEHRQALQQALNDVRYKAQLSVLASRVEERRIERDLLAQQLSRTHILAPRDGVALLDDPTEWLGKPVAIGERILRIADPEAAEIEAWVPLADAVPLPPRAPVTVFLNSDPLSPLRGQVRFVAHDSVARPDGAYAYRLRAELEKATGRRIGLKGTARVEGERVSLAYWVFRRPLAKIRNFVGY